VPPASAILMTAERPARPPPTTMILGDAAMNSSYLVGVLRTDLLYYPLSSCIGLQLFR
jgi:hypothetical protein